MSDEMPKGNTRVKSANDLADDDKLLEIKLQNAISREVIENKNNEKKLNDAEAMCHNAKILNTLSQKLVEIFFSKIGFIIWIVAYALLNIILYSCIHDRAASFYIGLVDKIALFIIVCILGKFLKDNLVLFIEMFKK